MTTKELQAIAEKNAVQALKWFAEAVKESTTPGSAVYKLLAMAAPIGEFNAWSKKALRFAEQADTERRIE
jgi:hypothetical protein